MNVINVPLYLRFKDRSRAFSLIEVLVALAVSTAVFSGIIIAYTQTARRAEWSGYSLAAQALSIQQIEQAKAAKWDRTTNELAGWTSLTGWTYNATNGVGTGYARYALDLPISGTNGIVWATNFVTVTMISLNNSDVPPVKLQMIRVDTVWRWISDKTPKLVTNSVATYMAPDNLSAELL